MLKKLVCLMIVLIASNGFAQVASQDDVCEAVNAFGTGGNNILVFFDASDKYDANKGKLSQSHAFDLSKIKKLNATDIDMKLGGIFDRDNLVDSFKNSKGKTINHFVGETSQHQISYAIDGYDDLGRMLVDVEGFANKTVVLEEPQGSTVDKDGFPVAAKEGKYDHYYWRIGKLCLNEKGCDVDQMRPTGPEQKMTRVTVHFERGQWFAPLAGMDVAVIQKGDVWALTYPTNKFPNVVGCLKK